MFIGVVVAPAKEAAHGVANDLRNAQAVQVQKREQPADAQVILALARRAVNRTFYFLPQCAAPRPSHIASAQAPQYKRSAQGNSRYTRSRSGVASQFKAPNSKNPIGASLNPEMIAG